MSYFLSNIRSNEAFEEKLYRCPLCNNKSFFSRYDPWSRSSNEEPDWIISYECDTCDVKYSIQNDGRYFGIVFRITPPPNNRTIVFDVYGCVGRIILTGKPYIEFNSSSSIEDLKILKEKANRYKILI